ncbi:hypothetical protein F5887DRAFT_987463 [Amanita rubescens]|nr:hypothetical protein F5887DRAFT_987463 [Amanita rubescens]
MTPTERVRTSSSPGLRLLPQPRSASPPRPITAADLSHPDETQILRQSVPSSVMTATTVATAVSSILDNGRSPSGQNKFGTIRTVTTDLTFEVPSLSRAEGNIIADDMAWRKSQESGSKSRGRKRLSKAPPAHLTRIAEEPEESVVDNPVLMPRDISRRRETSPDGFPPPPKVVLRRHSAKPNAGNRNAIYVPRSLGDTDDEEDDPGVPFPRTRPRRTVSGGASPLKESPSNRQRFNFPRGRFRSEVEESLAARRHMHPTEVELSSFRSRFESVVRSRRS